MNEVFIVVIQDRHGEVEIHPFSDAQMAVDLAWANVPVGTEAARMNEAMVEDGWMLYLPYGTEGDFVRVIRRKLVGRGS